ncbi:MAG: dTDP-4-dehydrorhamnose 3,5-epimerase [Candidatus Riflebacteria bacterium RBG_13_59_9]|nr:MAG: dTDP-4-dehydrorhamnose 3,5-epimerase [Candidatus Riflebacteria bacterium RBG_13_59_9]
MISGVVLRKLSPICDERGFLMEIQRVDWESFAGFGQAYITTAYPGIIKAWHAHRDQTDNFCVLRGMAKVVLYDGREDSSTKGEINEFFFGESNFGLLTIPPQVMHGFKNIGTDAVVILNLPNRLYNYEGPDEIRLPFDTDEIPYRWKPVNR